MPPSPTGPFYAGAVTAGADWATVSNAIGKPDGNTASNPNEGPGGGGHAPSQLVTSQHGFNLPPTAVIDGIVVIGKVKSVDSNDYVIQIQSGSKASLKNPTGFGAWWPAGLAFITWGSATDTWGQSWTPSDINSSGFGASISAMCTHGTDTAFVDSVSITVYWHTAPTNIPQSKYWIYKVFDSVTGNYLGNLPNVSSEFGYAQDINTAGSQITVNCAYSADTAGLPVGTLQDEAGNTLTDESGNSLTDDGITPLIGLGTSYNLIRNGNRIQVWEYSYYYPNGKCVFKGEIENIQAKYGGDTGDNDVQLLIYGDGNDLDGTAALSQQTLDQQQTTITGTTTINSSGSYPELGQAVNAGAGVTSINRITLNLSAASTNNPAVTVSLYALKAGGLLNLSAYASELTPDASSTQYITSTTAQNYDFIFNLDISSVVNSAGYYYVVAVSTSDRQGVNVSYNSSTASYALNMTSYNGATGVLYFKSYTFSDNTKPLYSSIDPSNIALSLVDSYGGKISADNTTIQDTGIIINNYQLNTASVYSGLQSCLTLAPSGYYYYVDLGTDLLYFQKSNTVADIVLTKGVHINTLNVTQTIEYVVNQVFVVGGTVSGNNIFTMDQDTASIARYGRRMLIHTDSNITNATDAHTVGKNLLYTQNVEQYQSVVTIIDRTMDINLIHVGLIFGFNGFGTYVDGLLAQVVHVDRKADSITCQLGILPKKTPNRVEQVIRGLTALNSLSNPTTPA